MANRQRPHGRPTILLLSMFMLLLVLLTQQVQGQRAIASLGSKIRDFGRKKSSSSTNKKGYIVQGELDDSSFFQETEILVAGLVVCVTVLLSFWNALFDKKDGESIIYFLYG
jgi:hypothetical protein